MAARALTITYPYTVQFAELQTRPLPSAGFSLNAELGKARPACVLYCDLYGVRLWLGRSSATCFQYKWWLCVERDGVILVDNAFLFKTREYVPTFDLNHGRSKGLHTVAAAAAPLLDGKLSAELLWEVLVHGQRDLVPYPAPLRPRRVYVPVAERRAAEAAAQAAAAAAAQASEE